ncbi:MAG: DNA repair protein RecO [Gemmataceae bacterium]
MAAEKALALVIRGMDWSETSRIVTLFTREFGKVRALAKGGRRLKSNFDVAFDLLNVCHVMFLRKAHGGLDLLTEAQAEERFPILRNDLHALYAGYYIAELLADGTQDYDPHPDLFDAALGTLRGLGKNPSPQPPPRSGEGEQVRTPKGSAPPSLLGKGAGGLGHQDPRDAIISFELVWLRELGYSPRLDACSACGADVVPPGISRVFISPLSGGALCPNCGPNAPDRRALTLPAWHALLGLEGLGPPRDVSGVRGELRGLFGQMVSFVLGRRPRMLSYLEDTR